MVMIAALLTAFLAIQGPPVVAQLPGTISGVLKNAEGRPVVGARISALAKPESQLEAASSADLSSIAQTDEQGRYKLEDIPPGQYYVIAGRVDVPTYYPGTAQVNEAAIVKVTPGAAIAGMDFAIGDGSIRTADTDLYRVAMGRKSVPLRVNAEDGSKLPVSAPGGTVFVEFERAADGAVTSIPVTATSGMLEYLLAVPSTEYRVSLRNLPEGYAVKSIMDGSRDMTGSSYAPNSPENLARRASEALNPLPAGAKIIFISNRGPSGPMTVTVGPIADNAPNASGVRITGVNRPGDRHPVFLSGTEGIVFSDGTFEFRNVPPGRHTIASVDLPGRARGLTVVVGNENLDNLELTEVATLPMDIQTPKSPGTTNDRPAGSSVSPVTLRVRVLEEKSKQPPPAGDVYINDRSGPAYSLDAEGKLAVKNLLPGVYRVEILMFGYSTVDEEITVGVEDISVELTSRKLY
jgi:hypothetical protein